VHCFMDGRDTPPNSARLRAAVAAKDARVGVGEIATLVGRYYAMDRDNRWERLELAYRALVHGEAETRTDDPVAALQQSYEAGVTENLSKPNCGGEGSEPRLPRGLIRDDSRDFFNFRADRARQMTYALRAGTSTVCGC